MTLIGQSKPKVVYWNNMPTPYFVGRFNALTSRGNVDAEAWFNFERAADRSWSVDSSEWRFDARYIPTVDIPGGVFHLPIRELSEVRPDLFVSLYESPSFVLGAAAGRQLARRSTFRVLPTFDSWVRRSQVKDTTKRLLFRAADGAKVPGPLGANVAGRYGIPKERISYVTQSIDVAHYGKALRVEESVRQSQRVKRGLHGCVFVYAGRLWSGKGIDDLLSAFESVLAEGYDASLLVVGDGVDEGAYKARVGQNRNVYFEGFVQPHDMPLIYALGDVFVFPTLGDPHGLVVEEAMAAGLPVITTEAAGDIRFRVPDGKAGFIVPPHNPTELAQRMTKLASVPPLRQSMAMVGRELALERSHEAYAVEFEHFVERILSMPARTGPAASTVRAIGAAVVRALPSRPVAPLVNGPR